MTASAPAISPPVVIAVALGAGMLVLATALAWRARATASSFGWMVVAGFAYAVLALAAALHLRESSGLRASAVQLLGVVLAALLGGVGSSGREPHGSASLGTASRGVAWLTLVGLPPTLGFHSKVMVYHSLLSAGWGGMTALAIAASGAGLLPALWAMRGPRVFLKGPRTLLAVALMGAIIVLGLCPQPGLALAGLLERLAGIA